MILAHTKALVSRHKSPQGVNCGWKFLSQDRPPSLQCRAPILSSCSVSIASSATNGVEHVQKWKIFNRDAEALHIQKPVVHSFTKARSLALKPHVLSHDARRSLETSRQRAQQNSVPKLSSPENLKAIAMLSLRIFLSHNPMALSQSICVYPLSPTYLPFHRYLYYSSLVLSVLYPTPPPLIKGAFAYSLTYSATASLYAILIIALSNAPIINLDIFALWSILSAACILILPLISWNKNLQSAQSRGAKSIVRIWGIWVTTGAVCSFVVLVRAKTLVASGNENILTPLDCQALAATKTMGHKLRNPETALVGDFDRLFGYLYNRIINAVSPLTFIPLIFGVVSCLLTVLPNQPQDHNEVWTSISNTDDEAEFSLPSALRGAYLVLRHLVLTATPAFFCAALTMNEIFLLKHRPASLPGAEEIYEVGQWGLLAGLGLVSAAAAVNWIVSQMGFHGESEVAVGGQFDDTVVMV